MHIKFINAGDNQGGVVSEGAQHSDSLCQQALDIMFSTYGSEAGVAALKWMPFSGLYIAGGIAPKNIDKMKSTVFLSAFHNKGRVSAFLKQIPIHVVLDENLGQRGAHLVAYQNLVLHTSTPHVADSVDASLSHSNDAKYIVEELKKEMSDKYVRKVDNSMRDSIRTAALATVVGLIWFAGMHIIFKE